MLCDAETTPSEAVGTNDGSDIWGVFTVLSITDNDDLLNSILWYNGKDDEKLLGFFHGFEDFRIKDTEEGDAKRVFSGGVLDIYRVDFGFAPDTIDQFNLGVSLANEDLFVSLVFQEIECSTAVQNETACAKTNASGEIDLENSTLSVVEGVGSGEKKFPADFTFRQTLLPCTGPCTQGVNDSFNFNITDGSFDAIKLPEPGALGLLGLGLIGLGLVGRRRKSV